MQFPNKIKPGDHIRIIAPSDSASIVTKERIRYAEERLESLGLIVSYGKNIYTDNDLSLRAVQDKIKDIHSAFED